MGEQDKDIKGNEDNTCNNYMETWISGHFFSGVPRAKIVEMWDYS